MTALAQHHRAGSTSQARSTTVGRLLDDDRCHTAGASKTTLYDAANRFANVYAAYQAAMASRRPMSVSDGGSPGPEDEERTTRAVQRFTDANTVLQQAGHAIRQATFVLCTEHHEESWQPPFHLAYHAVQGLKLLAEHYGLEWRGEDRRAA